MLRRLLQPALIATLAGTMLFTQTVFAADTTAKLPEAPAPQTEATAQAPIPAAIRNAHRLYMLPSVWDAHFDGPTNAYAIRFTTELTDCCGYTIVNAPDQADVLIQLHGVATERTDTVDGNTSIDYVTNLQMQFFDPATNVPLWSVDSTILPAYYGRSDDQAVRGSLDGLVAKLGPLGTPTGSVTTTATLLTAAPKALPATSPEATARLRLATAHTVYIEDQSADPNFLADPNLAFTNFTADMTQWGRFTLAATPATADLILQFQPLASAVTPGAAAAPYFKLTIIDPATKQQLWVITLPVQLGLSKKHVDLYAQSAANVVTQLQLLAGQPVPKPAMVALAPPAPNPHLPLEIVGLVLAPLILIGTAAGLHQYFTHN